MGAQVFSVPDHWSCCVKQWQQRLQGRWRARSPRHLFVLLDRPSTCCLKPLHLMKVPSLLHPPTASAVHNLAGPLCGSPSLLPLKLPEDFGPVLTRIVSRSREDSNVDGPRRHCSSWLAAAAVHCVFVSGASLYWSRCRRRKIGHGACRRKRSRMHVLQPYAIEPINPYMAEMKATCRELAASLADRPCRALLDATDSIDVSPDASAQARMEWVELLCDAEGLGNSLASIVVPPQALKDLHVRRPTLRNELRSQGLVVGARVDTGLLNFNGYGERITLGLPGLSKRCRESYRYGARFAHWRCVIDCSMELPTDVLLWESVNAMAKCAQICQAEGLVPALEVDICSSSGSHSAERSAYVGEKVYSQLVQQLHDQDVNLEAVVLMPSMCLPGAEAPPSRPDEMIQLTARTLWRTVPPAITCVALRAGQLAPKDAWHVIAEIRAVLLGSRTASVAPGCPSSWLYGLSVANGNLVLEPVWDAWDGDEDNVPAARSLLLRLARESIGDDRTGVV